MGTNVLNESNNEFTCPRCRARYYLTSLDLSKSDFTCAACNSRYNISTPVTRHPKWMSVASFVIIIASIVFGGLWGTSLVKPRLSDEHKKYMAQLIERDISEDFEPIVTFADSLVSLGFTNEACELCQTIPLAYFRRGNLPYYQILANPQTNLAAAIDGYMSQRNAVDQTTRAARILAEFSNSDTMRLFGARIDSMMFIFSAELDTFAMKLNAVSELPSIKPWISKYGFADGIKVGCGVVWIGMSSEMVKDIFGKPEDVTTQTTVDGKWEQWVYWKYVERSNSGTLGELLGLTYPVWTGKGRFFYFMNGNLSTWQETD